MDRMVPYLAWRNLWRNQTRSLITMASILFSVLLATSMLSLQAGTWDRIIGNVAAIHTGYVQVHKAGYWDDPVLENTLAASDSLERAILAVPGVEGLSPRLESFALASVRSKTVGVLVAGISPETEDRVTGLSSRVIEGGFLRKGDSGALVAQGLAGQLGAGPGDTLVLLGLGYHGAMAAGRFPVRGVVRFGSPDLNRSMVHLSLEAAQSLYSADARITAYIVLPGSPKAAEPAIRKLESSLGPGYETLGWEEMLPELKQHIEADSAGAYVMAGVLYIVIAFGILGTLVMMYFERRREFGMLISVGMSKARIAAMVFLESLCLAGIGVSAGMAGSVPVVWLLKTHPIRFTGKLAETYERFGFEAVLPAEFHAGIFLRQGLGVMVVAMLIALAPIYRVLRMDPVAARRQG